MQPVAFALVFLLAASRVYLGVHYLSDILTGFCLSMVLYFGASITYQRWEKRRPAIVSPLETTR
ncbi:phosphatase PAP2 family protein [Brevibacillus invocatus]|uniref:phosphatase PAP2 family protein n=1 Tax=Brevibacillus invocatus TaxID=173959 RepID=UPI0030B85487